MDKNVVRQLGIFVREMAQDDLGSKSHLSKDERQLRGGKEERQLCERVM